MAHRLTTATIMRRRFAPWFGLMFCVFRFTRLRTALAHGAQTYKQQAGNVVNENSANSSARSHSNGDDDDDNDDDGEEMTDLLNNTKLFREGPDAFVVAVALCLVSWRHLRRISIVHSTNTRISTTVVSTKVANTQRVVPLVCALVLLVTTLTSRRAGNKSQYENDSSSSSSDSILNTTTIFAVSSTMRGWWQRLTGSTALQIIPHHLGVPATNPRTVGCVFALVAQWLDPLSLARSAAVCKSCGVAFLSAESAAPSSTFSSVSVSLPSFTHTATINKIEAQTAGESSADENTRSNNNNNNNRKNNNNSTKESLLMTKTLRQYSQTEALHSLIVSRLIVLAKQQRDRYAIRNTHSRRHAGHIWECLPVHTIRSNDDIKYTWQRTKPVVVAVGMLLVTTPTSHSHHIAITIVSHQRVRVCYAADTVLVHELAPPYRVFEPVVSNNNNDSSNADLLYGIGEQSFRLRLHRPAERDTVDILLRQVGSTSAAFFQDDGQHDVTSHVLSPSSLSQPSWQTPIKSVSCGRAFAVAVLEDGGVVSWGNNNNVLGQLGQFGYSPPSRKNVFRSARRPSPLGLIDSPSRPRPVALPSHVVGVRVACGSNHTIVLSQRGDLWAWGSNANGQFGPVLPSPSLSTAGEKQNGVDAYWQAAWTPVQINLPKLLAAEKCMCDVLVADTTYHSDASETTRSSSCWSFAVDVSCSGESTAVLGVAAVHQSAVPVRRAHANGSERGGQVATWRLGVAGSLAKELGDLCTKPGDEWTITSDGAAGSGDKHVTVDMDAARVQPQGVELLSGDDTSVMNIFCTARRRREGGGGDQVDTTSAAAAVAAATSSSSPVGIVQKSKVGIEQLEKEGECDETVVLELKYIRVKLDTQIMRLNHTCRSRPPVYSATL